MILNQRHTGLVVRDLERSIGFYETLGLKVWRRETESGPFIDAVVGISGVRLEWAKLKGPDGSLLELIQYRSHPDHQPLVRAASNRLGCSHIAFTVTDIDETCRALTRLGGAIVNPPAASPDSRVRVAYGHDPDGILLELVEEVSRLG